MVQEYKAYYKSEIGLIEITGNEDGIMSLDFAEDDSKVCNVDETPHPSLVECLKQIDEYFKGIRKEFSIRMQLRGTDFQKRVWSELGRVPYGKTVSYRDIASAIGDQKAVRAVGSANGRNKIAIIIPCHRVIGSDGKLTGYAGGLWRKEWLLRHEGCL